MHRRDFLRTSTQAAVAGAVVSASSSAGRAAVTSASAADTPAIMNRYTAEDHRRRLQNIGACQRAIRSCLRKHLIANYLPAQCGYNLGEYPCRQPWDPGEYDERSRSTASS